jgi:N-acetylmuramoyl-L-alanine amidase
VRGYFTRQPVPGTWFAAADAAPEPAPAMLATRAFTPERSVVVGRGETLSGIAARNGVAVETLRAANRKRNDHVRVGERLTIPAPMVANNPQ